MTFGELALEIRRALADLAADIEWRDPERRLADSFPIGSKTDLRIGVERAGEDFLVNLFCDDVCCMRAVVKDSALVLLVSESMMDTIWRPPGALPRPLG